MDWFKRKKGISTNEKKEIPGGLWVKCQRCGEIIYLPELQKNLNVCSKCDYHFRISSNDYIKYLFDKNSFTEFGQNIKPGDPLKFKDTKKYTDRLKSAQKTTGLNDAVITGEAKIDKKPVIAALMDFSFIGGSMGSVVGEKIARAIDKAIEKKVPLIILSASGGARMMEGILSLMQMAKTSAKLAKLSENGIPYISILTDPTTGGTTASFAMLGDIHIAEPGALIGFAGQRVIKQTIGENLPEGFQRAEFLRSHGFIDLIVHRKEMKNILSKIISILWPAIVVTDQNNHQPTSTKADQTENSKKDLESQKIANKN
jgi:acetyl-CoA carboxylase carboxyl transferase subunit beta